MLRYASARRRNRSCRPESQCSREARAGYGQMKTSGNRSFMWFRDRVNQWNFAWKSCFRLPLLYSRGSRGCAVAEGLRFSCIAHPAASAASRISASTSRPGRAVRPGRALFSESARAATRGARGIGNSNTSRVARPGRALFPESARAATRGARGIGSSNTSRVARPGRALFPERRLPERAQVSVPVVFFDPAGLLRGQPGKRA